MHKSFYVGSEHSAAAIIYFAFKKLIDRYEDEGRTLAKEITYCPLNDGFKQIGPAAEKIGDIYCNDVDIAVWKYFNPDWKVEREKRFTEHSVCRLAWRKI